MSFAARRVLGYTLTERGIIWSWIRSKQKNNKHNESYHRRLLAGWIWEKWRTPQARQVALALGCTLARAFEIMLREERGD